MDGAVVWFTGLPASGKTTLARHLVRRLCDRGREPVLLDSDEIRARMVPPPGYDEEGRDGFYRTLAALACLIAGQGVITVVAATAHRRRWREAARAAAPRFVEVHVATPAEVCRARDPKHLYDRPSVHAALPGAGADYEPPLHPEVVAPHGDDERTIEAVIARLQLRPR